MKSRTPNPFNYQSSRRRIFFFFVLYSSTPFIHLRRRIWHLQHLVFTQSNFYSFITSERVWSKKRGRFFYQINWALKKKLSFLSVCHSICQDVFLRFPIAPSLLMRGYEARFLSILGFVRMNQSSKQCEGIATWMGFILWVVSSVCVKRWTH